MFPGVFGAGSLIISFFLDVSGVMEKGGIEHADDNSFGKGFHFQYPAVDEPHGGQKDIESMGQIVIFGAAGLVSGKIAVEQSDHLTENRSDFPETPVCIGMEEYFPDPFKDIISLFLVNQHIQLDIPALTHGNPLVI
jgi:hypothetical protein